MFISSFAMEMEGTTRERILRKGWREGQQEKERSRGQQVDGNIGKKGKEDYFVNKPVRKHPQQLAQMLPFHIPKVTCLQHASNWSEHHTHDHHFIAHTKEQCKSSGKIYCWHNDFFHQNLEKFY